MALKLIGAGRGRTGTLSLNGFVAVGTWTLLSHGRSADGSFTWPILGARGAASHTGLYLSAACLGAGS